MKHTHITPWFLLFLSLFFSLTACGIPSASADYLAWLDSPFTASGTAVIDGISYPVTLTGSTEAFTVQTATENGLSLTFAAASPGILFTADGASVTLPEDSGGIPALFRLFALSRADLTEVASDRAGDTPLVLTQFQSEAGAITVTLRASDLLPTRIEASQNGVTLSLTLDSFTQSP